MAQQEYISYWNISSYYWNISCMWLSGNVILEHVMRLSRNVILEHVMWPWKCHAATFHLTLEMSCCNISCGSGNSIQEHFMWLWKFHIGTFHVVQKIYWNISYDSLEMSYRNISCDSRNVILEHFMWLSSNVSFRP